jgi:hypothetical protein
METNCPAHIKRKSRCLSAANDDRRPAAGEPPAAAGEELFDVLKRKMTLALMKMKTRLPEIIVIVGLA